MSEPTGSDLHAHYELGEEAGRLDEPLGQVELARTLEVLAEHLPPAPAVVADVGGGPGRYALWLADAGYAVHHRDLVPLHVDQLRSADRAGRLDSAVADARDLDLAEDSVDAVLLLGPLYHLPQRADRLVDDVEVDGVLPQLSPGSFTGYTHRPDELREEVTSAGLLLDDLVGVEGLAFALSDLDRRMADPRDRDVVLAGARALQHVPELLGLSPHLLAVARVP